MVDVLLQSGDALKAQLARHQGNGADPIDTADLLAHPRWSTARPRPRPPEAPCQRRRDRPGGAAGPCPGGKPPTAARGAGADGRPAGRPPQAESLFELFQEITDLGTIEPLDGGQAADGLRRFRIVTATADAELLDLCTFHVAREQLRLESGGAGYGFFPGSPGAPARPPRRSGQDPGYGFFDRRTRAPGAASRGAATRCRRPRRRPVRRSRPPPHRAPRRPPPTPSRARCVCRSRRSTS
jgi:two-component system chemotaxis sensor kinase CheA